MAVKPVSLVCFFFNFSFFLKRRSETEKCFYDLRHKEEYEVKGRAGKNENGLKKTTEGTRGSCQIPSSFEQGQRREGSITVPPAIRSKFNRSWVTTYESVVPPHTLLLGSRSVSTRTHEISPKAPGLSTSMCYSVTW